MSERASTWGEAREHISTLFNGHLPYDEDDEQVCMEAWQRNPARFTKEVERLAAKQASGEVSWPWRVLVKVAPQIRSAVDSGAVSDPSAERSRAVRRFDGWMRNAGLHFDRYADVADEVFGERGLLRHWRTDDELVSYVKHSWEEHRQRGVEIELAADERAARQKMLSEPVPPMPGIER